MRLGVIVLERNGALPFRDGGIEAESAVSMGSAGLGGALAAPGSDGALLVTGLPANTSAVLR